MNRLSRLLKDLRVRPDHAIASVIFVLAAALYIRTAAPTLGGGWDSEEFQHVAYTLGVAHSTGYPLYLLLGKVFTTVFPFGNIAHRMNILSALLTACAAVFVYLGALQLTQRQIPSIATTALFATNDSVWRQAGVASVGPLNLIFLTAIVYVLLLWRDRKASLSAVAFLLGLGLTHHRSVLLLVLAAAAFIGFTNSEIVRRPRELVRGLCWFALPLMLYLYLPLVGNNSPWYSNTLQGFTSYVSGSETGSYTRGTLLELFQAFIQIIQYLHDSFGILGAGLILVGAVSFLARAHQWKEYRTDSSTILLLGLPVLLYLGFSTFYTGEPDRYLVLPFVFLAYWFAIGAGAVESFIERRFSSLLRQLGAQTAFAALLVLLVVLPLGDRYRVADWSTFTRVYQQWDEITTLPIPRGAVLVGTWGQLNAMRYMQRVENRRPDLQFVGTLYDPAPQTDAARAAFGDGRAIYLSPGIALPIGTYRYALLGPLLEVRDAPQMQPPAPQTNIAVNAMLTLADFGLNTALEPYTPTTDIAPGRTVRVALDWRVDAAVKDFLIRLQLYDPEAQLISQKDEPPVRGLYAASEWQRGEYVSDVHNVLIPPGTPPGQYQVKLQTLDANSQSPTSDPLALAWLNVERATDLTRDQVFVQHPLDLALNDRVVLWGVGGLDGARCAGETIGISLVWYAREDVGTDFAAQFALIDPSGRRVSEWPRAPIPFYPSREWRKGEILKAYYDLPLPVDLPPAEYSVAVGLGAPDLAPIGKIQIEQR